MKNNTELFVEKVVSRYQKEIISIEILGSRIGENDLSISDIDILILCKNKKDISKIFKTAQEIQEEIFEVKTTEFNKFVQRFILASSSHGGIHLMVIAVDEFTEDIYPKSFRLRILMFFVGRNIFFSGIKENHELLYGEDVLSRITVSKTYFGENLRSLLFPVIIFVFSSINILINRNFFVIWCSKVVKYQIMHLERIYKINGREIKLNLEDKLFYDRLKLLRYEPEKYDGNLFSLFIHVWILLIKNFRFIF